MIFWTLITPKISSSSRLESNLISVFSMCRTPPYVEHINDTGSTWRWAWWLRCRWPAPNEIQTIHGDFGIRRPSIVFLCRCLYAGNDLKRSRKLNVHNHFMISAWRRIMNFPSVSQYCFLKGTNARGGSYRKGQLHLNWAIKSKWESRGSWLNCPHEKDTRLTTTG